ncbi:interleukin-1 receptor accessory protein [Gadus morhua]|uniref:Interleukin 1 receptor accessory protein n=1 Tax=Gadus morhua TaxID=8049 RepID=A0A8C4ZPT5_GADMO|nr:interleukin-1 receptor accessory protein [Gadus morhua]
MKLARIQAPQEPASGRRPVRERSGTGPYSMSVFIIFFWCLSATAGEHSTAITTSSDQSELLCHDWGMSVDAVRVINGEAGWLFCPLFSHSLYNYSSAHSSGLSLFWYHLPPEQDLERPIKYSQRVSKDRESLWFQPANENDTGQYICTLRNRTSCTKIAMSLGVVSSGTDCPHLVAMVPLTVPIPVQEGKTLSCPGLEHAAKMADSAPSVTWYHNCTKYPFWDHHREVKGDKLFVHQMGLMYEGLYYCRVSYTRKSLPLKFTRSLNVTAVSPSFTSKVPVILIPNKERKFHVRLGREAKLVCRVTFPFLENSPQAIWWTVDGKTLDSLTHTRFSETNRRVEEVTYGDQTVVRELLLTELQREDLMTEFNCSVKNNKGFSTKRAQLQEEAYSPSVELGCGLGGTLLLMLVLFLVYHVFWLELLLLYRSWFGTDERYTDEKEFDVYISYVRDGEEEQFAVSTLRHVLENHLGYSVCIFDRDSLPGGTITDETLSFVGRSRRLLVVLSPGFASRGTQALLELKAGLDHMALGGHLRVILVQYRPLKGQAWVGELRRARGVLAVLRWKGDKSKELTSRFWKRLRLELPLQRRKDSELGTVRTYQSQSSTSSQTGLLSPGGLAVHKAQYSGGKL